MNTNKETTATEQMGAVAHARPSALRRTVEKVTDGSWHSMIYAALFVVIAIAVTMVFMASMNSIKSMIATALASNPPVQAAPVFSAADLESAANKVGVSVTLGTTTPSTATSSASASAGPIIGKTAVSIVVLNGTPTTGLAGALKTLLEQNGFSAIATGNAPAASQTVVSFKASAQIFENSVMAIVNSQYPSAIATTAPDTDLHDIAIVIGQ